MTLLRTAPNRLEHDYCDGNIYLVESKASGSTPPAKQGRGGGRGRGHGLPLRLPCPLSVATNGQSTERDDWRTIGANCVQMAGTFFRRTQVFHPAIFPQTVFRQILTLRDFVVLKKVPVAVCSLLLATCDARALCFCCELLWKLTCDSLALNPWMRRTKIRCE